MDIKQLRDKFFRECCAKQENGLQDVNLTPHNTFEWFVKHFKITESKKYSKKEVENLLFSLAEHYAMTSTKEELKDFNNFTKNNLMKNLDSDIQNSLNSFSKISKSKTPNKNRTDDSKNENP